MKIIKGKNGGYHFLKKGILIYKTKSDTYASIAMSRGYEYIGNWWWMELNITFNHDKRYLKNASLLDFKPTQEERDKYNIIKRLLG